jgi:hypothetical protein
MRLLLALFFLLFAASAHADGEEPLSLRADALPLPIRALHAGCAKPDEVVNIATERVGKAVLIFVSCPTEGAGSWPAELALRFDRSVRAEVPMAVYLARDRKGRGAVRLRFPVLLGDRTEATIGTLPPNAQADYEADGPRSPWIITLWKPDHPGMCKIRARWKIAGGKAELWRWEEAPRCTADDGPVYGTILDRGPPRLSRE